MDADSPRTPSTRAFAFGPFHLEPARRLLLWNGEPAPLAPKVFDTLHELVRRRGEVVDKDTLMQILWPDTVVEENNLSQHIASLRRVLMDPRGANRYIVTHPGRGYSFVGDVSVVDPMPVPMSRETTVAVLPFENRSADPEREYLVDGLTEETIAALSQADPRNLLVISRTSTMAYKHLTGDVTRIGRELGAAYVVEGWLRAEGGRLRTTANLVRTRDHTQIWSATFDSEPHSILDFQRELAGVIAQQVRLRIEPSRLQAMGYRQPVHGEAFDAYLRGRHFWHQLTPASTRRALELFELTTRVEPDYALAWSGISDALCAAPISGDMMPGDVLPAASRAAANAVRARPDLAEAQASVGFLKFWLEWDWRGAEAAFRRAIELDPRYSLSHRALGILYSHVRRVEASLAAMRRARELDPLLPLQHALSAQVAFAARDYALAARFARQALAIDPDFWIGHMQLAQSSERLDDFETVHRALRDAGRTSGGNSKVVALRGYLLARLGRRDEAGEALRTLIETSHERYIPPCMVALILVGLGDIESAANWIDRAFAVRDVHLIFVPIDPKWDAAREHPRIAAVLQQCGLSID